jgi:hypothetical protein
VKIPALYRAVGSETLRFQISLLFRKIGLPHIFSVSRSYLQFSNADPRMFVGGSPFSRSISERSRGLATRHNRDRLGFPLLVSVPTDFRNSGAHGFIVALAEVSPAVEALAGNIFCWIGTQ